MGAIIDRRPTDINPHVFWIEGDKLLFLAAFGVVQGDLGHEFVLARVPGGGSNLEPEMEVRKRTRLTMSDGNAAGNGLCPYHGISLARRRILAKPKGFPRIGN